MTVDHGHQVTSVQEASAECQQLNAGDVILSVDGVDTSGLNHSEISNVLVRKQYATRVLELKRIEEGSRPWTRVEQDIAVQLEGDWIKRRGIGPSKHDDEVLKLEFNAREVQFSDVQFSLSEPLGIDVDPETLELVGFTLWRL